ncbi:MAG TPA: DUF3320 domain-containing protein [Gammaproteobacteria bacterium]|nr:DUF3320 domain-containing protein [Gammaproteobacteria bacterium]
MASLEQQEKPTTRQIFNVVSHDDGDTATLYVNVGEKSLSVPYQEALFLVPSDVAPHEVTNQDMTEIVGKIVEAESPIHENEIVTRVRMLWNLARAGNRIQAKVKAGLMQAAQHGIIIQEGDFYLKQGVDVQVRNRNNVSSPSLRKPEHLPPQEIRKTILVLIKANFGASRDQLPSEVAHLLGFKSTSAQLREVIEPEIQELLNAGKLQERGDHLTLCDTVNMA